LRVLAFLAMGVAAGVGAQEIVTLPTRPGVTQSFFIAGMGEHKPTAVALLYVGGPGVINLRVEGGQPKFGDRNFLPRSRREFIRNGILPVVLDAPSDHAAEMSDDFRTSADHVTDTRAVIANLRKRYPGLPVFLIGTSKGTLSAAYLGRSLEGEVAGVVQTSTLFYLGSGRRAMMRLAAFDWASIKAPLLFVHHTGDGCSSTPYAEARRLAERYPLISVSGGKPAESPPCEPLAAHGFYGREAETVDAIAAWMLKKPFPKEIS
jgi:hypothetical protein